LEKKGKILAVQTRISQIRPRKTCLKCYPFKFLCSLPKSRSMRTHKTWNKRYFFPLFSFESRKIIFFHFHIFNENEMKCFFKYFLFGSTENRNRYPWRSVTFARLSGWKVRRLPPGIKGSAAPNCVVQIVVVTGRCTARYFRPRKNKERRHFKNGKIKATYFVGNSYKVITTCVVSFHLSQWGIKRVPSIKFVMKIQPTKSTGRKFEILMMWHIFFYAESEILIEHLKKKVVFFDSTHKFKLKTSFFSKCAIDFFSFKSKKSFFFSYFIWWKSKMRTSFVESKSEPSITFFCGTEKTFRVKTRLLPFKSWQTIFLLSLQEKL